MEQIEQSSFKFQMTTAMEKVAALEKRIRGVCGGTSASKTVSIMTWLIDYCQRQQGRNKVVDVVSESLPHLKKGAMQDFTNIMKAQGYWEEERWHATDRIYTFETGNILQFYSVDTYGKAHGPRRDVLFINEGNNLPWRIVDQLITRTREIVWIDWNPSEEFWFYTEIKEKRKDVDFLTLTYLDNEALDLITVEEIESHKENKAWWQVYGLGQLGVIEARIYKNWKIIDEIPKDAVLDKRGGDFGYTNDPTAIIDVYRWNNSFIFDQILYRKGMKNKQIADVINAQDEDVLSIWDSSEPKSIDELKDYGVNAQPAVKGPGSVYQGIQYVQAQKCYVTARSVDTIKEYRGYLFIVDKNGVITNDPEEGNDHAMDAIRYPLTRFSPRRRPRPRPHMRDNIVEQYWKK